MSIGKRIRSLLRRDRLDSELDEEVRFHLESKIADYIASGMSPGDARRAALRAFGRVQQTKEECRDTRGTQWLDNLWQDLRFGLRMLRKSPGFTAVAVLTLALGIGANTAVFSLIDGVMLRSLPVREPGQLVLFEWRAHRDFINGEYSSFGDCGESGLLGPSGCSFPLPIFRRIEAEQNLFAGVLACAGPAELDLSGDGPARVIEGEIVSGDYFSTLGVKALIGRTLGLDDDSVSASPVAVLSYAYWQSAYGGSRSVLGRTILLNKTPFRIVGVAEPSFTNLSPGKTQDLWVTIAMMPRLQIDWGSRIETMENWWLLMIARLKPGVSIGQAQAATSLMFRNEVLYGPKPFAKPSDDPEIVAGRAQDTLVGGRRRFSSLLYTLMFAVGIILLIACANVAGLLLSRAATRQKEMAVRLALGASRATVLRQLLTESVLLSALGGVIGILFAFWGLHAITGVITGQANGRSPYVIRPDWLVLAFALGVCVFTGLLFGLAPAFRGTRVDLTPALKETASSLPGSAGARGGLRLGNALVIAQVALSVIVLIGAGLLVRTLENLRSANPGFDVRNLLLFEIEPGRLGYKGVQVQGLLTELRERLAAIPGVSSVTYSSMALLTGGGWNTTVHVEGQPAGSVSHMHMFAPGPGFFDTMGIPLREGRLFTPEDFEQVQQKYQAKNAAPNRPAGARPQPAGTAAQPTSPGPITASVVVNEAFVRKYFPFQNPLGKGIGEEHGNSGSSGGAWTTNSSSRDWQIIGVVGDTKYDTLRHDVGPVVYLPFTNSYGGYLELRTAVDPHTLVPTVQNVVKDVDRALPISKVTTQTEQIDRLMSQERQIARLSGFFALLALILACVGLYGLLSYEVSRRTREIGIRMTLGARRPDVLRMVVRQGLVLAAVGVGSGVAVALGVTRYLDSMLYRVHADDPLTIIAVAILLGGVATAACYLPARRATNIDPMVALRHE
jgi:predicted permease